MLANQSICIIPMWVILCIGFPFTEIRVIRGKAGFGGRILSSSLRDVEFTVS